MFSSKSVKIYIIFALSFCQACSYWRGETGATPPPPSYVAAELKSDVPFSTKEPDVYQTEIVTTESGGLEEKTFAAKSGTNRLLILDFQEKAETTFLQIGDGQTFLIARNQKIYAENKTETGGSAGETANDFLIGELLNQKTGASFEALGTENNVARYRVNLDEAVNSEIIILVDEKIGLPVKQEFYSVAGDEKILMMTMELKNFTLQTGAGIFEVPKNYRKVSTKEFREIMQRARMR